MTGSFLAGHDVILRPLEEKGNLVYGFANLVAYREDEMMQEHLVRAEERRRSETPNGVMTTSASPTLGGTSGLSLWWVEMAAGASGPVHVFDVEQLWSVVQGSADVTVDDTVSEVSAGDTVVLPAGATRQVHAREALRVVVCGAGHAVASVPGETRSRGVPPWIS